MHDDLIAVTGVTGDVGQRCGLSVPQTLL